MASSIPSNWKRRSAASLERSGAVPSPDWRVAVIGAGAAGLAAAHALKRAGYRRVTVLESSERVGGKCCTIRLAGRTYELGAVLLTTAYRHVRALARDTGLRPTATMSGICLDLDTRRTSLRVPTVRDAQLRDIALALARLGAELVRHRRLWRPGFANLDPDLVAPFDAWAQRHGLTIAARMMEPWLTAFGYGYSSEIPAAYALKYATVFGLTFELLDGGYQELWELVAGSLDVHRNVTVRSIRRRPDGVLVDADAGSGRFDAIVIACPADAALGVLDATDEERDLLSRVLWQDYRVVVASVKRFCGGRYLFFPEHFDASTRGNAMCSHRRWPDSDVRLFYALGDGHTPLDDTAERTAAMVRAAGGQVTSIHRTIGWRYFPHVTSADMAAGFYDRLEALQGARRTYYVGELLSFGTVENVVAYSNALVEGHFLAGERFNLRRKRFEPVTRQSSIDPDLGPRRQ